MARVVVGTPNLVFLGDWRFASEVSETFSHFALALSDASASAVS